MNEMKSVLLLSSILMVGKYVHGGCWASPSFATYVTVNDAFEQQLHNVNLGKSLNAAEQRQGEWQQNTYAHINDSSACERAVCLCQINRVSSAIAMHTTK